MTDNGWPVYDFDETSPFFRESNRPRTRALLSAHVAAGGSLSSFIASQPAPRDLSPVMAEIDASMERRAKALRATSNENRKQAAVSQ